MLPNPLIARAYLTRGLRLWLVTRIVVTAAMVFSATKPFPASTASIVEIIALSLAVGFIDVQRRRERALLGNLAVNPLVLGAMFMAPAVAGEIVLHVITMRVS